MMMNKNKSNEWNEWFQITPQTEYLLVVEKEGIFHRLCEDRFYKYVSASVFVCILLYCMNTITHLGISDYILFRIIISAHHHC